MNIIITKNFRKDFNKIFKDKYIIDFCKNFLYLKEINLDFPYKKYKFNIAWINIRWVYIISIKNIILPIFITKKSDKKYWMNLVTNKDFLKILKLKYQKWLIDFENNEFKIYNEKWELI